jgi:hypothetical protein
MTPFTYALQRAELSLVSSSRGQQKAGRITGGGMTKEVTFELVDGPINERIDDAYRAKYHDSSYLRPMIGARARSATLKVTLREIGA